MRIAQLTILLLALTIRLVCADDNIAMPDFSSYPKSKAFRLFNSTQPDTNFNTNQPFVLSVKVFPSESTNSVQGVDVYRISSCEYRVSTHSLEILGFNSWSRGYRDTTNGETSGYFNGHPDGRSISETEFREINSAIEEFPNENVSPPLERLAIVGFKKGTNWVTHTYDRQAFPPAMQKVCKLIGPQIEVKESK